MQAEIHNKISQSGSNLSDRLEDKLTGDFFGALRYLPIEIGLQSVLSGVRFQTAAGQMQWHEEMMQLTGYMEQLKFWPAHYEGEIDLLLEFIQSNIGIEIKYLSGISSEDDESNELIDDTASIHQLSRYSRMLADIKKEKEAFLIFLAPYPMMRSVEKSLSVRNIINPHVHLGFLCWQDIYDALIKIDTASLDTGQRLIIEDLTALLNKKRLYRFKGFGEFRTISNEAYVFTGEQPEIQLWEWPATQISRRNHYVCNT
ncbi:hypothetical protein [Bacillus sp. FJAT-42376]|uniref:hypothetical protein n=1 Tax=Bacillus sp. FJAT-42376 TaxID=2014076 RepID=UPI0019D23A81|nr:hypothetical protein [Bacillus sp. FJAT-42376]